MRVKRCSMISIRKPLTRNVAKKNSSVLLTFRVVHANTF